MDMNEYHKAIEEVQLKWEHILGLLNDDEVAILLYALERFEPSHIEWRSETILIWEGILSMMLIEYDKRGLHYSNYQKFTRPRSSEE